MTTTISIGSPVLPKETKLKSSPSPRVRVLSSKEHTSMEPGEASFRVYYGATGAAVPFVWESQPGTPKHPIFDNMSSNDQIAPPLTPPPSYKSSYSSRKEISFRNSWSFSALFSRRRSVSHDVTPTSSSSSSSYSEHIRSWSISSSNSSAASFSSPHTRKKHTRHKRSSSFCFSGHKSLLQGDDAEESGSGSPPSSTMCFGFRKKQGCYTMEDIKNAIL